MIAADLVVVLQELHHRARRSRPHLAHHAQDVALGLGRVGADDKVGPAQGVKVGGVVGDKKGRVHQLAQLFARRGQLDVIHRVARLGRGHVMRHRAHAADALRDARHLFDRAALAELFKAAQLGDDQVGVFQPALLVQEQIDATVTFQSRDWVDADFFHIPILLPSVARYLYLSSLKIESARLKR